MMFNLTILPGIKRLFAINYTNIYTGNRQIEYTSENISLLSAVRKRWRYDASR